MKRTFKVQNVKCGGCANILREKLTDVFGEIEVNLEVEPREITLKIDEERLNELGSSLKQLGYPFIGEEMGFVDSASTKAKSFVSCAIGKIQS